MAYVSDAEGELLRQVIISQGLSKPVLDSVNHFYNYGIAEILSSTTILTPDGFIGKFSNPFLIRPSITDAKGGGKPRPLWPYEARRAELNYMAQLWAIFEFNGQSATVFLGMIPAIIQSVACHLYGLTQEERYEHGEPEKDPGGYAIVKGLERVLLNIENLRASEAFLYEDKETFVVRYTSQSLISTTVNIVKEVKIPKEDATNIHVTFDAIGTNLNTINVFYIFYILGLTRAPVEQALEVIENFITDDDPNRQARRRREMRYYMQETITTFYDQSGGNQIRIYDQLDKKVRDTTIKNSPQRNNLLADLVRRELFKNIPLNYKNANDFINSPQTYIQGLEPILIAKVRLLASMIAKYVDFKNGYRQADDRDAWGNKQLADAGKHLSRAFNTIWENMVKKIGDSFITKNFKDASRINAAGVVNQNYMGDQFMYAFNRGSFTVGMKKNQRDVTVVDNLDRDNILASIAHIRRISTPTNRRAKIREKRLIHNSQWGVACPVFSPEGEACTRLGTLVLMKDGTEIEIEKLKDGDEILTIDPITLQQSTSKIMQHFVKSSEEYGKSMLKVTTFNGRNIICTDDHPFLTQCGWVYAHNLNPQIHLVAIYPNFKPIPHIVSDVRLILDEKIFVEKLQNIGIKSSLIGKHTQDLQEKGLLPLYNNSNLLPLLSRIAGFTLADGSLHHSGDSFAASYSFGTQYDGETFLDDMEHLGFHRNGLRYQENTVIDKETGREATHHCWGTAYAGCFATLLLSLDLTYGRRVETPSKPVPEWVTTGTLAVKREFVSGFQGGDGSKIIWTKRHTKVKAGKINFSRTLQHKVPQYADSLLFFMTQIANICIELGIEVLNVRKENESPDRCVVRIDFSDKEENVMKYMETISYRYATTKSIAGYHISEYLRYKHNMIQERIKLKEAIVKLRSQGIMPSKIANQLGLTTRQVTSILEYNEINANGGTLAPKDTLGFEEWNNFNFVKDTCLFMSIDEIEQQSNCMIADFTTESKNHSMISNGFVTHNCGLSKDSAITTYGSLDRDDTKIRNYLDGRQIIPGARIILYNQQYWIQMPDDSLKPFIQGYHQVPEGVAYYTEAVYSPIPTTQQKYPLFLNGVPIGFCNSTTLREQFILLRRFGEIWFDTGIILNSDKELKIFTNSGRVCRPLLVVDKTTQKLMIEINGDQGKPLQVLMAKGDVEYIDVAEQEQIHLLIAEGVRRLTVSRDELPAARQLYEDLLNDPNATPVQLQSSLNEIERLHNQMKYTHAEIDPTVILGISAISMPFAEFNPGPRDTYQSSMVRQALGGNSMRNELRFDTNLKTLLEPGVPTVSTDAHEYLGLDEYPSGRELVIAITTYGGSNQEDAITINQAAIDLGLFLMMIYHSYRVTICPTRNNCQEIIGVPDHPPSQASRYSKLDKSTGIVKVGMEVGPKDCLVGKTVICNGQIQNDSLYVERGKEGIIDEVYITTNVDGCILIRIRVRELRKLQPGDKLASRYAQKGTIGAILPEKDMPWIVSDSPSLDGVKPHLIFNPHGIPSRMTLGKLFEILVGKATAITGERFNSTAFRRFGQPTKPGEQPKNSLDAFKDQLVKMGFSRSGKERMVEGTTGLEMEAEIYVGTTYYQLLKHLVKDKMQARGFGGVQFLTRQPMSGIRKEGGLRIGKILPKCLQLNCKQVSVVGGDTTKIGETLVRSLILTL
jgi:DNA-directed RNA polymerase beta subunit